MFLSPGGPISTTTGNNDSNMLIGVDAESEGVEEEGPDAADVTDDKTSSAIKKSSTKKKSKKKKLVMNISGTKYHAVRYVGKNIYKMKLSHADDEDWDICW